MMNKLILIPDEIEMTGLELVLKYLELLGENLELCGIENIMSPITGEVVLTDELARVRGILEGLIENRAWLTNQ